MKKYVLKATALAIGALAGGSAFAALDFTAVSPAPQTTRTYANELSYATAAAAIATGETVKTKLGFGVSDGQNRYIRIDVTGVKFKDSTGWNVTAVNAAAAANNFAGFTVVAGGGAGDTYAIIQVTGKAATGNAADDVVTITLPALQTTAGNAASPTATYALYETAVAAVAAAANTQLAAPKTGSLFMFGTGLKFELTPGSATAIVAESFKQFTGPVLTAQLGQFSYGVAVDGNGDTVKKASGGNVTLADLVDAGTKVTIGADFSAADTTANEGVFLVSGANTCAAGPVFDTAGTLNAAKTSFSYTLNATALDAKLCYTVAGTKAIPAQSVSADLTPVALATTTVADPAAGTIGQIKRDGATLVAPFVTIHPDYLSRIVLTSSYAAEAAVEASVIAEDGVACSTALPYKTTIKAGKQLVINTKDICGSTSTGSTRFGVQVTVAAPANSVNGAFNVMNYDQVTGKTNSLITYVMTAPGVAATQP